MKMNKANHVESEANRQSASARRRGRHVSVDRQPYAPAPTRARNLERGVGTVYQGGSIVGRGE